MKLSFEIQNRIIISLPKLQERRVRNVFFIGIFMLMSYLSYTQNKPKVTVSVDTTKIRIGEQISYQLSVDNVETGVIFSELQLDVTGKIEIVETLDIDTLKNRLVRKYVLTSFDSGRYVIPQQKINVWSQEYTTDSIVVDVATVAVDTLKQKMFPIKAVHNEPYTFEDVKPYLWWILVVLLVLALILYLIFRKKETLEEIEARIPPYDLALKRLKELDDKQLWQQNKTKKYYVELTDIVRAYIEREMRIPALESTTNDLIATITNINESSALNISDEALQKLQRLLKEADLVKFAKYTPLSNEIELHRDDAEDIVNSMHPSIAGSVTTNDVKSIRKTIIVQKPTYKTPSMLVKILIILGFLLIGLFFILSISKSAKNIKKKVQQNSLKIDTEDVE